MEVYLDHAATTKVFDEVAKAVCDVFTVNYGNASSLHSFGQIARNAYESAREAIAKIIAVSPQEIFFTSGGTESDNIAILGFLKKNFPDGGHLITTQIEHPAVLEVMKELEKRGYDVTYLAPDSDGRVSPKDFKKAIRKDTILASIMWVNNETGMEQPIEEISKIAKENRITLHSDAVQAVGKLKINASLVDMLSASGHKFYAPKGCGFLYVKSGVQISPVMLGGGHERGLRSGTENVPGAVGMATALKLIYDNYSDWRNKIKFLKERILDKIYSIPNSHVNGRDAVFSHVNVSFKDVSGEALATALDLRGIAVSTASACSSHHGSVKSHVLQAMRLDDWIVNGAIRISLGYDNTENEIDYFLEVLDEEIHRLRNISQG